MIPLSAFRPTAEGGGSRRRHRCGGLSCEQSRIVLPRRRPRLSAPRLGHDRKRAPPRDSSGRRRGGVDGLPVEGGGGPSRVFVGDPRGGGGETKRPRGGGGAGRHPDL